MARWMPELEAFFHYRNLDVSTLKELCRRWQPAIYKGFQKRAMHTALADIHESIDELKYYREHFLIPSAPAGVRSDSGLGFWRARIALFGLNAATVSGRRFDVRAADQVDAIRHGGEDARYRGFRLSPSRKPSSVSRIDFGWPGRLMISAA